MHVVFSTKDRLPLIRPSFRDDLFAYMGGVLNGNDCQSLAVGGADDHVHLCFQLGKARSIQALVGEVKSSSSHWVKEKFPAEGRLFYWQAGYAAMSVSASHVEAVRSYILSQEQHHRKESFEVEFVRLLRKNRVGYDERHLWD